jgi:hypothetical protein
LTFACTACGRPTITRIPSGMCYRSECKTARKLKTGSEINIHALRDKLASRAPTTGSLVGMVTRFDGWDLLYQSSSQPWPELPRRG